MSTSQRRLSNDDEEVAAIIEAAYQRAATFESDCSNAAASYSYASIDQGDIEKCLAEVLSSSATTRSSREATAPPVKYQLSSSAPSSYPPGADKVHIDWSEHYHDRQESSHDEILILDNVGRFASRHSKQRQRSNNKNTTTIGAADRASFVAEYYKPKLSSSSAMDVDTVDIPVNNSASANKTSDYNENSNDCDPVIYISNHSLQSISTLGTLGFKSSAAKKTVDPFTASLDSNERSAETQPPPTHPPPPPPPPPLARPVKRQTSTPTEQNQRLSSSLVKHPGKGRPNVTHDSQREDLSWQDRKAFEHNFKALKHVPTPSPSEQRSSSTRTKLSPIPQSPYVVEGATPEVADTPLTYHVSCSLPHQHNKQPHNSRSIPTHPQAQPQLGSFTSSAAVQTMKDNIQSLTSSTAPQKMNDIDIQLTAKSSRKTRSHTGQLPPLPINAQQATPTTSASRRAVSSENKHSSSETNLRKVAVRREVTGNRNLGKSWPVSGSRSHVQYQLMKDNDEINLSRVAVRQDTVDENFSKSWPAGGRLPTGGISQLHQQHQTKKNDDDLFKKVKVGYQNDREKDYPPPPPPPPRHHTLSPHSVTCAISSPVVSPTDSEEATKQQSKYNNANHPSRNGGLSKNIRQDRRKMPTLPFPSTNTRPMQIRSTMQLQQTQRDFNITLMKLLHQVELLKRINALAAMQYHARYFWFFTVPISTFIIMSMSLVMACAAIDGLDIDVRIGYAMGSVFCSIMAIVFYSLAAKFGMNHHAALHRIARNEMTKAGFRLDQLTKYKGYGLLSGMHSMKACTNAIRTLHRLDVYIQAINQCTTPAPPKGIDNIYQLLLTQINRICRTCPHAIEKRLSYIMDDDNCDSADHATTAPIDLKIDAYNCLEEELRRFVLYPVFMPNAEDVVSHTIDIFFEDTTNFDNSSCRNTELNSLM